MSGHRDRPAQHGTRGRRTEADDDARPQARELQFEPRRAGLDLAEPWLGVQAALAARFPLEVFHRVREIHVRPLDASRRQRLLQYAARWTDERCAGPIFLIAWLLAHEHDPRSRTAGAEHRLRGAPPEIARPAARRLRAGLVECRAFREPGGRVEAIWHVGAVSARAGRP